MYRDLRWYVGSKRIRNAKVAGSTPVSGNLFSDVCVQYFAIFSTPNSIKVAIDCNMSTSSFVVGNKQPYKSLSEFM